MMFEKGVFKKGFHKSIILIMLLSIAIIFYLSLIFISPNLTGFVTVDAQGGTVQEMTIYTNPNPPVWCAVYGNISSGNEESTITCSAGQVISQELSSEFTVNSSTNIYAGTSLNIDITNITIINASIVDAFMGINSNHAESATNTFTELWNFTINGTTYELIATRTKPIGSGFYTGAFESNGELFFVTNFVNTTGFEGVNVGYQLLLPLESGNTTSFKMFADTNFSAPQCPALFEINSSTLQNGSVLINWQTIQGALSYTLYYINGLDIDGEIVFNEIDKISSISQSSILVSPRAREVHYSVKAIVPNGECWSNNTVSSFTIPISPTWNLISTPVVQNNKSVEAVLANISGSYSSVYAFNNNNKQYGYYIKSGQVVFKSFDNITHEKAYWVDSTISTNLTISGQTQTSLNVTLYPDTNIVGMPLIIGNRTVEYVFRTIDGNYSAIYEFDNDGKQYGYYIISGEVIFSSFDYTTPANGYWVIVGENNYNLVI